MKDILYAVVGYILLIWFIGLLIAFPLVRWIVGIVFLLIIGYIVYLVLFSDADESDWLKSKYGEGYEEAIKNGQLSLNRAYPCVLNPYYTDKKI